MKNFRKIVAILAATLMLFSVMPLGAIVLAEEANLIVNGDFENGLDGWNTYQGTTTGTGRDGVGTAANIKGNGGWGGMLDQTVTVEAGETYDIVIWAKTNANGANIQILDGENKLANNWFTATEWTKLEYSVVPTGTTIKINFCGGGNGVAEDVLVDDISIIKYVPVMGVVNGDFENGDEGWALGSAASIIDDGGNSVLQLDNPNQWAEAALQVANVEQDTTYTLTWKSKRISGTGPFNLYLLTNSNANYTVTGQNWMNSTSTDWVEHSVKISTATNNVVKLKFSTEASAPGVILIDDITLKADPKPVVGEVFNGDFETGDLTGWNKYQSTVISADAAYEGTYGAHLQGNGGWGGMLDQTISVEAGKSYELSFWIKAVTSGVNIQIKDANNSGATLTSGGWFTGTEWTQRVYTVTAASDAIYLNFCGGGTGNAESVYLDNVSLVELKDPSFDGYLYNGDFETGKASPWNIYGSSEVCAEAAYEGDYGLKMIGNGGWGGTGDQAFTMEVGKKYAINLMIKTVANGVNIQIKDNGATVANDWVNDAADWTKKTFEITATSVNGQINFCGGGNNIATTVYVDNIEVIELKDPSFDGYLYNGDFEAGSLTKWNVYQSTVLSKDAAYEGNFGAHLQGNGGWGAMIEQATTALEAGATYNLTFWVKANASGANWTLKQNGTTIEGVSGWANSSDWAKISKDFVAPADGAAVLNFCGGGNGVAEDLYLDSVVITKIADAHTHNYVGTVTQAATCVADGVMTYACECGEGTYTEAIPATGIHAYDNCDDADCNVCGAERTVPAHNLTYNAAVVPANCSETGNVENWYCADCGGYFSDAEGINGLNPAWITYTGDHVRPADAVDCATVGCEICGEELIGAGAHDVDLCLGGTCSKCGEEVAGWGHENNNPLCTDGTCTRCGVAVAGLGHENGAMNACCDGECAYGCGLIYPATEDHVDADANDYCDNCWSHLACVDEDADGVCDVCWSEMPAEEIVYGDVNGDGIVNTIDVAMLQQYAGGWDVTLGAGADANGDGIVNTIDVALVQQLVGGWDVTLGPTP